MDALMRCLQSAHAKAETLRLGSLPLRLGVAGLREVMPAKIQKQRMPLMAKIIEFYVPRNFRRNDKWISRQERGKVIEFPVPTKKSA